MEKKKPRIKKKKPVSVAALKKNGRPTDYREEYDELAFNYCLLGANDVEMAAFFDVSEVTFNAWKQKYPSFLKSLMAGKKEANAKVARSLYNRALGGIKVTEEKSDANGGYTLVKELPPDTTAAIFFLKNRERGKWTDRQEIDHTSKGESINICIEKTYSENSSNSKTDTGN